MMAVSSPLFSNFGVFLADPKNNKLNTIETPGIPVHYSSSQPSIVHSEFKNFDEINGDNDHFDGTVKKLNHNASERDRRKKFNSLCSSLRSLLPATDHTKKISFPATVARVIKYIPDLKKEVERLTQKKEDLTLRSIPKKEYSADFNKQTIIRGGIQSSLSVISANQVGNREVIIHISIVKTNKSSFAEAVSELEEEGLLLLNSSSFETLGDRVFYNLHFQAQGTLPINVQILRDKLLAYYEKEDKLLPPWISGSFTT